MPPPVPPKVKLGRMIVGNPTVSSAASASSRLWAIAERGDFEPDPVHRLAELQAVLGHLDRRGIGADQLDPEPVERAVLVQRQRGVERGLPAHRRQDRVRPLLFADPATTAGVTGSM